MTNDKGQGVTALLPGELIEFGAEGDLASVSHSDAEINARYVKGEIRIVTEQARYPINTIAGIVEDPSYYLSPEYQRRHRWTAERQSKLIESLIMNVPLPPIFLYEFDYSKYEVMDGLQRLTAIHDFYRDKFTLEGLVEWVELNGKRYSELPSKIKEGIDRRYLSSVILLKETARNEVEALRLKQLVFERINSGGVRLSPQETRNAIFDGPLNQTCMRLSRNASLCRLWSIPVPEKEELEGGAPSSDRVMHEQFREMADVELVLRFFAYRQKHRLQQSALKYYLDLFLRHGNKLPSETLAGMADIFERAVGLAEELLGERAFWLFRRRANNWSWLERPTMAAYDPLMYVLSELLPHASALLSQAEKVRAGMEKFYQENYDTFEGRNVNSTALIERENKYREYFTSFTNSDAKK